jgi:DNA recombination protein RmuC
MGPAIIIIIAAAVVIGLVLYIHYLIRKSQTAMIQQFKTEVMSEIGNSFGSASLEALKNNSQQFLTLAETKLNEKTRENVQTLESKKELIDSTLTQIKSEMDKVEQLIKAFEKDREQKYGEINKGLQNQSDQVLRLADEAKNLNQLLSGTKSRGQWGERMAEDILNAIGMVENINYIKQTQAEGTKGRPDFTFLLPDGFKVNMDVKFPLDNFRKYVECEDKNLKEGYMAAYIRDARSTLKNIDAREYINLEQKTLDFVIVFIPHEQGYAFLMEHDINFMDDALKQKIVVCSPWTLYAFLAVIKQSVDNFKLVQSANEILMLMNAFYKQWDLYVSSQDLLGNKIEAVQAEYSKLITTRKNQLEKILEKIDELTRRKGLTLPDETEG